MTNKMKIRWDNCEKIANRIRDVLFDVFISKKEVELLYDRIQQKGLLEIFLDKTSIDNIPNIYNMAEWPEYKNILLIREINNKRATPLQKQEQKGDLSKINIAIWYLKKIGSAQSARNLLEAAIAATQTYHEP